MDILNDGKNQETAQYISGMISNTLKNDGLSLLGITISANKLNSISDAAFRGVVPEATQKVSSN